MTLYRLIYVIFYIYKTVHLKRRRASNKVFMTVRGVAADFQCIVQLVRIITLKQEETWSNKAIEMARRLV